jgi:hypothetical protein
MKQVKKEGSLQGSMVEHLQKVILFPEVTNLINN